MVLDSDWAAGCGNVARPYIRFEGRSLRLGLTVVDFLVDFWSKSGCSPFMKRSWDDVK